MKGLLLSSLLVFSLSVFVKHASDPHAGVFA